jgi:pimeloyl-ACP methyl ester carboxylesterase
LLVIVRTQDGVRLHVLVDELPDAPVTVVFSHGFTAAHGEFLLQREALPGRARVVLYDQRGHGLSDQSLPRHATIDQLGRDLQDVLEATCPTGPVVLVGHSMGGMTLMSWARQYPSEVGTRVVGAFLLATSAGELITAGPVARLVRILTWLRMLALAMWLLRLVSPMVTKARKPGTKAGYRWIRHYLFGTDDADPDLVVLVQAMLEATPFTTSAMFYPTFLAHDESAGLPVLKAIPTTILCGTSDRLTPIGHSRAMDRVLQDVLIEVPGCGHSVNVSRPELVNEAILDLVDRALGQSRVAATTSSA